MNGTSKHWLIVGVVFALGFTTAWIVRDGSPRPARAGQPPRPGDLNGDDIVDVSDPVYLLVHLFRGGPPPVAAEPTVGPVSTVVIVRHAERETNGEDPGLTPEGQLRAERLAAIL